jgi:DNA polymerase epsilon subunit 3
MKEMLKGVALTEMPPLADQEKCQTAELISLCFPSTTSTAILCRSFKRSRVRQSRFKLPTGAHPRHVAPEQRRLGSRVAWRLPPVRSSIFDFEAPAPGPSGNDATPVLLKTTMSSNTASPPTDPKTPEAAKSSAGSKTPESATAKQQQLPSAVEFEPPLACVRRILKHSLPSSTNVGKDASAAFARACGIFIIYLTACANDFARENKRQTITANDVMAAVKVRQNKQRLDGLHRAVC